MAETHRQSAVILDGEIAVVEFGMHRIFDELVVAPILRFRREGLRPMPACVQLGARMTSTPSNDSTA